MGSDPVFIPYQIMEVELSEPIAPLLSANFGVDQLPLQVMVLVRLHSYPISLLELCLETGQMTAPAFAERIQQELGPQINDHLRADGLPEITSFSAAGVPVSHTPACQYARQQVLANAPYVSVLVATHDRLDSLKVCLQSLLAMEYPNFDIVVIDNAPSTRATAEWIASEFSGSARVRYAYEPRAGLARAHNRGLMETNAPYVAITDDDVIVDRYWLAEIMKNFFCADHVGCVTGMILPAEMQTQAQYLIEHSVGFAKGFKRQQYDLKAHRPSHPLFPYAAGLFGSGANMAFDATILKRLGGFDDHLGAGSRAKGGDDLAAFFQTIINGYTLVYEPAAMIYHHHSRTYEQLRKMAYGYGAGLTAFLTKTVIDRPMQALDLARRVPYGLFYLLSKRSPKNARKEEAYPSQLNWIERRGMLAGPFLYLGSRLQHSWNQKKNKMKTVPLHTRKVKA